MRERRSLGRWGTMALVVGLGGYLGMILFGGLLRDLAPAWWWILVAVPGLWALDRLLVAAEDRGWIYWRHRSASTTTLGNAMLEIQALIEPDKRHVVEERTRQGADLPGVGAPPDPDPPRDQPPLGT